MFRVIGRSSAGLPIAEDRASQFRALIVESWVDVPRELIMADPDKSKQDPAAAESGIDWANVLSEVQIMVDLNRDANEQWKAEQVQPNPSEKDEKPAGEEKI